MNIDAIKGKMEEMFNVPVTVGTHDYWSAYGYQSCHWPLKMRAIRAVRMLRGFNCG